MGLPVAERVEQARLELGGEILLAQLARHADRVPHLFEVREAPIAVADVLLEAIAVVCREPSFEVLRDQLDDFVADHVARLPHLRAIPPGIPPALRAPLSARGAGGLSDWSR